MSPHTLSIRLSELREAGVVAHDPDGDWTLTPLGRKLGPVLTALDQWSAEWERTVKPDES